MPRIRRAIQRKVKDLNQVYSAAVIGLVEDVDDYGPACGSGLSNRVLEDVVEYAVRSCFFPKKHQVGFKGWAGGRGPASTRRYRSQSLIIVHPRCRVYGTIRYNLLGVDTFPI